MGNCIFQSKFMFTPYAAVLLCEVAFVKIWSWYESGGCGTAVIMEGAS